MEIFNKKNKENKRRFSLQKSFQSFKKEYFKSSHKTKKKSSKSLIMDKEKKRNIFNNLKVNIYNRKGKEIICEFKNPWSKKKKINSKYIKKKELGKGASSISYIFESTEDWKEYAIKIIDKNKLAKGKSIQLIKDEIIIQKELAHEKIVKIKKYFEDNQNVYIVLELCKNHTLADLVKRRGYLTEIEVQCYMFQLIQGLKYLHSNNIIHRDLKPNNLFLDDKLELKIGDFGLIAKLINDKERRKTICGTPCYMAPEIYEPDEKGYSFEVDIWSIGVIMFNLLTGQLPFYDENKDRFIIQQKIIEGNFKFPSNPTISEVAKDLIKQILVKDPKKRPSLTQILYHDFFHICKFPRFNNISTLIDKPTLEEIKKYNPGFNESSITNKKVVNKDLYKLFVPDILKVEYEDINIYKFADTQNIEFNCFITFFHKSNTYNFHYFNLNNGFIGIIYKNENNNINEYLLNSETNKFYEINIVLNKEEDEINIYNDIQECSTYLKKKFEQLIEYDKIVTIKTKKKENKYMSTNFKDSADKTKLVYINQFFEEKYATLVFLSDETKQTIFKDKCEILLSEKKNILGSIDKDRNMSIIPLYKISNISNNNFTKRFKYIHKISYEYIKNKIEKKNGIK